MARTTLTPLINKLRGMTGLGTADYTLGTAAFWDNDQVQDVLDAHRVDIVREQLLKVPKYIGGGSVEYYEYRSEYEWFEQTSGGSAIFVVEDGLGADIGTASWSADYNKGIITFGSDTGGTTYYLTARYFDIYAAAAEMARQTANYYAKSFDVTTDGHNLKRSQLRQMFMDMAKDFEAQSSIGTWEFFSE